MSSLNHDENARRTAIDPSQSFIVQAPAGSGKTELLTQRYLRLLCYTKKAPEEIIAITFTRKAAAEMRQRVLRALKTATQNTPPEEPHKQLTWKLAKKALHRDQQHHWKLLQNPNRLRILTFDALAAYLVKQIPLTANFSSQINLVENATHYYQEAIEALLLSFSKPSPWQQAIKTLLLHLDNRASLLETLLIEILSQRDQWLPHIMKHQSNTEQLKRYLNAALRQVTLETLQAAKKAFEKALPATLRAELIELAHFAALHCSQEETNNPIKNCLGITQLNCRLDYFPQWHGVSHLLLTQQGQWRQRLTKNQGFPAKGSTPEESKLFKSNKQRLQTLLTQLANTAQNFLRERLVDLQLCPPQSYDDSQWALLQALIDLLPVVVAHLNLIFKSQNAADFIELNLAALRALGTAEQPTDLALNLDYRISHLLVDEFQDTSVTQFQLLENLMAGWEPGDGRTLFLVGDPMQSIYRFRHAEVSLFLQAQQRGIASITLQTLELSKNFRSYPQVVAWNNSTFKTIFTDADAVDLTSGATPFTPAECALTVDRKIAPHEGSVNWYPSYNDAGEQETQILIEVIKTLQNKHADDSIAILVRSRTHLHEIIKGLHKKRISFQAVQLEPLANTTEIQDLHNLTRALLHRADRIAWLALLRAPYCGLKLHDLFIIAQATQDPTVLTTLKNETLLNELSTDARLRLQYCTPLLCTAIENLRTQRLSEVLQTLWQELSGPATLTQVNQMVNVGDYIGLIEQLEKNTTVLSLHRIEEALQKLFAKPNPNANAKLQIMTIHKAKGLEFDHVLLPGLHRQPPPETKQLMKWLERPSQTGSHDLILAPIKATHEGTEDPIYAYLARVEKIKQGHEYARLLYVATTRAKKSLHLFASALIDGKKLKPPHPHSFLALLWSQAKPDFKTKEIEATTRSATALPLASEHMLHRFSEAHFRQQASKTILNPPLHNKIFDQESLELPTLATRISARITGTVIHEVLEQIANKGVEKWYHSFQKNDLTLQWQARLRELGMPIAVINEGVSLITSAVHNTLTDPRGQWILSNQHLDIRNEFSLSFFENGTLTKCIIDRCFVDKQGRRWIIDYKTTTTPERELPRYQQQLHTYARTLQKLEQRPIRLALYFPLTCHWFEWDCPQRTCTK